MAECTWEVEIRVLRSIEALQAQRLNFRIRGSWTSCFQSWTEPGSLFAAGAVVEYRSSISAHRKHAERAVVKTGRQRQGNAD